MPPSCFNYCICKPRCLPRKLITSSRQLDVYKAKMGRNTGSCYFRLLPFFPPDFFVPGLPDEAMDSLSLRLALPLGGEEGTANFAGDGGVLEVTGLASEFGTTLPYLASVSW